jgi:hypothetical protein
LIRVAWTTKAALVLIAAVLIPIGLAVAAGATNGSDPGDDGGDVVIVVRS